MECGAKQGYHTGTTATRGDNSAKIGLLSISVIYYEVSSVTKPHSDLSVKLLHPFLSHTCSSDARWERYHSALRRDRERCDVKE
jgi:hypothetical protein